MHCPFHLRVLVALLLVATSAQAHAETTLNAGVRLSHDSNVNGSPDTPSKANHRSDSYLTTSLSAVYYTPLDKERTNYFVGQVGAMFANYRTYTNLNNSTLVASGGIYRQLSPKWSGQLMGRGFIRETRQPDRDSSGYGAALEIKRQLSEKVWLKGLLDYEDSSANSRTFSNTGTTYGLNLGYLPRKDRFINAGLSRSERSFKSVTPFSTKSTVWFIDGTEKISKNLYFNLGYAFADNDSNFAGTGYTSHVISAGLSFSY